MVAMQKLSPVIHDCCLSFSPLSCLQVYNEVKNFTNPDFTRFLRSKREWDVKETQALVPFHF